MLGVIRTLHYHADVGNTLGKEATKTHKYSNTVANIPVQKEVLCLQDPNEGQLLMIKALKIIMTWMTKNMYRHSVDLRSDTHMKIAGFCESPLNFIMALNLSDSISLGHFDSLFPFFFFF